MYIITARAYILEWGLNDELAHAHQMICRHGYQGHGVCGSDEYFSTATLPDCPCDYQSIKVLSDTPPVTIVIQRKLLVATSLIRSPHCIETMSRKS